MNKRPLSVTIIACLYIAAGVIGLAYHLPEFRANPFEYDSILGSLTRLTAIVCGVFMLRGHNWARWLALVWIAYHVVMGGLHSWRDLLFHSLLFAVFAYFLLRRRATDYFRATGTEETRQASG